MLTRCSINSTGGLAMELPATTQRVTLHTEKAVYEKIMKEMETRLGTTWITPKR